MATAIILPGGGLAPAQPASTESGSVTTGSIADGQVRLRDQGPPRLGWTAPVPSQTPPDWAASTLPTPIADDAFFDRPAGIDALPPGAIIRSRQVRLDNVTYPENNAVQIMVRSTDSRGRPITGTATLIVPTARWEGPGTRPVLAIDQAINSLGAKCTPGYAMAHQPMGWKCRRCPRTRSSADRPS